MPTLEEKANNALEAVNQLITLLERCGEGNWASEFRPVETALKTALKDNKDNKYKKAIDLYGSVPKPAVGSFPDLILCDDNGHKVNREFCNFFFFSEFAVVGQR